MSDTLDQYSALLQSLFNRRGITDPKQAEAFLHPSYETELHDPFLMNDMQTAVERITTAIDNKEQIVIFSDYDCDGIPGAVVLHDFFKAICYEQFSNYIPHRHYEGFGLSVAAVEKLAKAGAQLVITIDCGTSSNEAIERAADLGVDVIVTDHHEPGSELPPATAIVNPKLGSYPFTELCGAGVVFKLVQALIAHGSHELTVGWEKWWLDMVGIATIADMVPLVGENRVLATYGLQVLRKSRRPGLQQLLRKQRANQAYLTEDDIGFTIGPRINAASRMDNPEFAFTLLSTTDEGEAGACVDQLEALNTKRKTTVAQMTKEVHKRMKELTAVPEVIVLGNPKWRPSLVGLTASKLAEEYNRPAFIWGRDGNNEIKGSCRGGGGVSVVKLMEAVPELFSEYGGHHGAGGFSVHEEHIHTFPTVLNEAYLKIGDAAKVQTEVVIDHECTLDEITTTTLREQQSLAPFGVANPKPLFKIASVVPQEVSIFGKTKEHTKLTFSTEGVAKEAIAFFKLPAHFTKEPVAGKQLTLLAELEQSFFMGRLQTRLRIVDVV